MKLDLILRIADISAAEFSTQLVAVGLFIVPRDEYCLSIREHKARAK
jgi:hypothetical protein